MQEFIELYRKLPDPMKTALFFAMSILASTLPEQNKQ